MHISVCEHCEYIHCGVEQCINHSSGACMLDNPALTVELDGHGMYCWDYEKEEDYVDYGW